MSKHKSINEKAKKLFHLLGFNHKQFSKTSEIPYATVHEFFNCDKNVTLGNFQKITKQLGLDLEDMFEDRINQVLGKSSKKSQDNDDIAALINSLDKFQRKEMLATAINLNKIRKNSKIADVIERIEKKYMH